LLDLSFSLLDNRCTVQTKLFLKVRVRGVIPSTET